jgi:hypothetical protein
MNPKPGRGTRNGKGRDGKEQGKSGGEKHVEGGKHAGERRQVERAAAGAKRRGRSLNPKPAEQDLERRYEEVNVFEGNFFHFEKKTRSRLRRLRF